LRWFFHALEQAAILSTQAIIYFMTTTLTECIDQALKARGWRYDSGEEQFMAPDHELDWEELIDLLPDLTLDELREYQDAKFDERCRARAGG
jgi:hypothetical protein